MILSYLASRRRQRRRGAAIQHWRTLSLSTGARGGDTNCAAGKLAHVLPAPAGGDGGVWCVLGPNLVAVGDDATDALSINQPPGAGFCWLGTDFLGRDVYPPAAGRSISLVIGLLTMVMSVHYLRLQPAPSRVTSAG